MGGKTAQELMIDADSYPHIPYWFTISQAVGIIQNTLVEKDKYVLQPMAGLVFDEKYNFMGTLTMKDILRGVEPRYLEHSTKAQGVPSTEESLASLWGSLFAEKVRERADRQVREVMRPAGHILAPDDDVSKAAYYLVHEDLPLLPVIKDGKILGLVRMTEVFHEVVGILLNTQAAENIR